MVERIFVSTLNNMFDSVNFNYQLSPEYNALQKKYIKRKNKYTKFPYIPESFFVASIPNHPITINIFNQIKTFWTTTLESITTKEILCEKMNYLMNNLATKVFNINILEYELFNIFKDIPEDRILKEFKKQLLNQLWNCGYIYIYLQMYIALVEYIDNEETVIEQDAGDVTLNTPYNNSLCLIDGETNINYCKKITIRKDTEVVVLIPLSLYRLIKWGDTTNERITFENTILYEELKHITKKSDAKKIIKKYIENGIYQIKFSHWTRDSDFVNLLAKLFKTNKSPPKDTAIPTSIGKKGGKYYKNTRNNVITIKKKHNRKIIHTRRKN
jgi:hypothetical protein